jgi:hypothetical protein
MLTKLWFESLKERGHPEDLGIDVRIILKRLLGKDGCGVRIAFIWFRIGAGGGFF